MTVFGRAYPRIVGQQREKSWMFFDILLPMLSVSAYVFVYRAIQAPEDYIGFVVVGGAMTAFWMNILWSMSSQLYWEKEQGNLALYIVSPAPMLAILLGMALGGLVATTIRRGDHHPAWQPALPGQLCRRQFLDAAGSLFRQHGCAVWHGDDDCLPFSAALTAKPGTSPTWRRSRSTWFPVFTFPSRVSFLGGHAAASIIPLTLGLDAMRQLVFATGPSLGFLSVNLELVILIGFVLCL